MRLPPALEAVPVTSVEALLASPQRTVIDLRSPSEFAEDHVPGARNVPLFDDLERKLVGTLYARSSPAAAFAAGERVVRQKVGAFVNEIAGLAGWKVPAVDLDERVARFCAGGIEEIEAELATAPVEVLAPGAVVLHCWRGGLRSRSVVALLRGLGLERAHGLAGGYKAYRLSVRRQLDAFVAPPTFVLRGLTGVGKTLVLRELERLRPGWTLDLEGLAGHRSSILGMVGLEPVSQKRFDSRLAARLGRGFPGLCVVEGESRKVGDVIQPAPLWDALQSGTSIQLTATVARRVEILTEDYLSSDANRAPLAAQLPFIENRLGPGKWSGELVRLFETGREAELVEILLEHYYDPLYLHSERRHEHAATIQVEDATRAAEEAVAVIERLSSAIRVAP